jgi:DNA-binding beta-propeller fold protein YncE
VRACVWQSHASEIRIHPSGKFVLVANRGHDSIACFAVDDSPSGRGMLSLSHITASGGAFPRNFNFDATGRFLIVGNQNSNNLAVFAFETADGGKMTLVDTKHQPSPNYVFAMPDMAAANLPASHGSVEGKGTGDVTVEVGDKREVAASTALDVAESERATFPRSHSSKKSLHLPWALLGGFSALIFLGAVGASLN